MSGYKKAPLCGGASSIPFMSDLLEQHHLASAVETVS